MSKAVPHIFADITAAIEDMHAVAVEGQVADQSPDIQRVLIGSLRQGIRRLNRTVALAYHTIDRPGL